MPGVEVSVSARTARELSELSKVAKETGNRDLKLAVARNMRLATAPARAAIPASALAMLPKRGGFAERVARSKVSTRTTTTGARIGVRIKLDGNLDVSSLNNRGRLRHKTFGQLPWHDQSVPEGFVDKPLTALLPQTQAAISAALAEIGRKFT